VVKVGKSGLRINLALDNFLSLLREYICNAGGKIRISVQIMPSTFPTVFSEPFGRYEYLQR